MRVKRPITKYNNEKEASRIKCYAFKDIQNLDKVLIDLERTGVTIARAKSQFYHVGIKIVEYIYDTDGRFSNTF